jgi:DNA segregation ATPase FtsK/SpoIIIE-like protein
MNNDDIQEKIMIQVEARLKVYEAGQDSLVRMVEGIYAQLQKLEHVLREQEISLITDDHEDVQLSEALVNQAIELVRKERLATISKLQRGLRIPYQIAFALMDRLEADGVIGPYNGESMRVVNSYH